MVDSRQSQKNYQVKGLTGPVTIQIDCWGVPHIEAQNIADAFFGQGYAAALMRLWQLDLNHRRQVGKLAEVFGAAFVPFDHVARLLMFRGPIESEWAKLDSKVEGIASAFVAGINARIDEIQADPALLPPEFVALKMTPDRWIKDDLLRCRVSASPNIQGEIRRVMLAQRNALALDALAHPLEPAWPLTVPAGLDVFKISSDDLKLLNYRVAPLPFDKIVQVAGADQATVAELFQPDIDSRNGSNAWVIGPKHTHTGRAILANDPHLPYSVPSPRMVCHLKAPGLNLIGAGPVWRPGVQFGHNEYIAFGRTDFQIDQEDLYVLEVNAAGTQYQGFKATESIARISEEILVRGQLPVKVDLAFTPLGPIIAEDRQVGRAVVLRAAWLEPGAATNLEYVPKVFATNWDEFRAAIRHAVWGTNYMFADTHGNIGWQSAGRVPVRPNHDGLMPVPAAGDYPWSGILPIESMPGEFNPPRGWIASANQMPFPADWPVAERRISFEWTANDRHRRLVSIFSDMKPNHSITDSWCVQQDIYSGRAKVLVDLLRQTQGGDTTARALLERWEHDIAADSPAAGLYEYWWAYLQREVRSLVVPANINDLITLVHPHVALAALTNPDSRFGAQPEIKRNALLVLCLDRAYAHLKTLAQTLGTQSDQVIPNWGRLHERHLKHPLKSKLPGARAELADVTGRGSSGDGSTVYARWWPGIDHHTVTGGSSFRAVIDVGNWWVSMASMGPGQAGSPGDQHYSDLYQPWMDNVPVPLAFHQEQVNELTRSVINLAASSD